MKLTPPFAPDRPYVRYFLVACALFAAAFVLGYVAPPGTRKQVTDAFQAYLAGYGEMAGGTLFFYILLHNVMASLVLVGSGPVFGIIPVLATCSNGFVLGIVYRAGAEALGHARAVSDLLPHGVFEIAALLYAASYGLWLGLSAIRRVRGKESTPLRFHLEHAFRRYFAVAFPLMVVAATIETYLMLRTR